MNLLVPVYELADAFRDADARLEAQHASGVGQIGIGQPHVARLIGLALDARFLAERRGDERNQAVEAHAVAAAQIDCLDRAGSRTSGPLERGEDTVHAVGNIGIVALARPISMHPHRASPGDQVRKLVDRQIGTLPRDRKSTRLNSSHTVISYAVFCLKKKTLTWIGSDQLTP